MILKQNEELKDLSYLINHDINNYLNNIVLYTNLVEDSSSEYLEKINQTVKKSQEFINQSLKIAEVGLIIEKKEKISLNNLLSDIENLIPNNIKLVYNSLPKIFGDYERMFQVFRNIIDNAIKHGKADKIFITVTNQKDKLCLEISDNGKTISKEIVDEFNSGYKSIMCSETGIGLKIIKKIIQAHGWEVSLSVEEKNTFRILI